MNEAPRIAVTLGDPAGIGPEITARSLAALLPDTDSRFVLIGDLDSWNRVVEHLSISFDRYGDRIELMDARPREAGHAPCSTVVETGRPSAAGGRSAHAAVLAGIDIALARKVDALVTAPLSKESLALAGIPLTGHTEILEQRTGARRAVLTLCAGRVRITFATNHVPLAEVPRRLNRERLSETIDVTERGVRQLFGIARPRIAVCGLNPHAGEGGQLGDEEARVVRPAVEVARREGLDCHGPLPADALFASRERREAFDAIVALYHDQGTIPAKMLSDGRGFNVTLGLPILRTSPDHGTAFDIATRFTADPEPMTTAIRVAIDFVEQTRLNSAPTRR